MGRFKAPGTIYENWILADPEDLRQALRRTDYSFARLKVKEGVDVKALGEKLSQDERYELRVLPEEVYFADFAAGFSHFQQFAVLLAVVLAVAGILTGMNTLHNSVVGRIREIGTLRVLGFSKAKVFVAFLFEAVLLTGLAGLVGCGVGLLSHGLPVRVPVAATFPIVVDAVARGGDDGGPCDGHPRTPLPHAPRAPDGRAGSGEGVVDGAHRAARPAPGRGVRRRAGAGARARARSRRPAARAGAARAVPGAARPRGDPRGPPGAPRRRLRLRRGRRARDPGPGGPAANPELATSFERLGSKPEPPRAQVAARRDAAHRDRREAGGAGRGGGGAGRRRRGPRRPRALRDRGGGRAPAPAHRRAGADARPRPRADRGHGGTAEAARAAVLGGPGGRGGDPAPCGRPRREPRRAGRGRGRADRRAARARRAPRARPLLDRGVHRRLPRRLRAARGRRDARGEPRDRGPVGRADRPPRPR